MTEALSVDELAMQVQAGAADLASLIEAFLRSTAIAPSTKDPTTEEFSPVWTMIDGAPHLAVGTTLDSLRPIGDTARFAMTVSGRQAIFGLGDRAGLLVHTNSGSFAIGPELAGEIRSSHEADV